MRLDPTRTLRSVALAAWAGLFTYLWLSGRWAEFIGPRTEWVVPFGAIVLIVVTVVSLVGIRTSGPVQRPSVGELVSVAVLVAPVLALIAVPEPRLGALAAENKGDAAPLVLDEDAERDAATPADEELELFDVVAANNGYADTVGVGSRVKLTGIFRDPDRETATSFLVTRFRISCCAADAQGYSVRVEPAGRPPKDVEQDDWVEVTGTMARSGGEWIVKGTKAREIEPPANPYLTGS